MGCPLNKLSIEELGTALVVLPLPFIIIWTAICSHILVERLEQIFLSSPLLLQDRQFIKSLGLLGEIITCGCVFLICLMPTLSVRRGLAVRAEVERMPKKLKLWIYPPFFALSLWFGALLLSGIVHGW